MSFERMPYIPSPSSRTAEATEWGFKLLMAYDLVLRMEGLHSPAVPLNEQQALDIYAKAETLARKLGQ